MQVVFEGIQCSQGCLYVPALPLDCCTGMLTARAFMSWEAFLSLSQMWYIIPSCAYGAFPACFDSTCNDATII